MNFDSASMWLFGILSLVATAWVYWRQSQKLKLIVDPVSLNLIDLESESKKQIKDMLTVLWGERKIHKLDITEIKVSNDSRAISKDDVIEPLTIIFGNAEVLDAKIMEKIPSSMNVDLTIEGSKILFSVPLINKGESFTVKVITNDLKNPSVIVADARIKNGSVMN